MATYGVYSDDLVAKVKMTSLEHASGGTVGFFGTTPAVRPSVTFNATITATFAAGTLGFGFSSSAEAASVIGAIKDIQHVLTTLGLWE
jgi:hypothetical protein